MSRIFEALQQSTREAAVQSPSSAAPAKAAELIPRNGETPSLLRPVQTFSLPASPEKRLVAVTDSLGFGAEKLRMLSARLKFAQHQAGLKRLLVTSTIVGEGKTTITANLAVILAQQQQKVLLIDGDLHQAALTALLGLASRPGIGEWWQRQREIDDFTYCADGIPLWFLPSGKAVEQPLAMLHSTEFQQQIEGISHRFDWVVIDSPPLAPLADAATWSTMADCVLLVARKAVTPKKLLEESFTLLDRAKVLGVVLNDADSEEQRYYAKYYDRSGSRRPANGLPEASKK
jgi:capsular exopolysaccharide synthesis family protein